jgi:hypothetical protein
MFDALGKPLAVRAVEDARLVASAEITRLLNFRGLCGDAVRMFEPHGPWTESFLKLRVDCYQAIGDSRLAAATHDLAQFVENQAVR